MDLDEIRAFLAVAKTGSFAAAAKQSGFARATLRRRIGELEGRIGGELFERRSDGATLTKRGRVFASRAERVVAEATALVSSTRQVDDAVDDVVRFAIPRGAPIETAVMVGSMVRGTKGRLRVDTTVCDDPFARLLFDADVAVRFGDEPAPRPWKTVQGPPVLEGCFATPGYLAKCGTPETVDDLANHDLFGWHDEGRPADTWALRDGGTTQVAVLSASNDLELVKAATMIGQGIGYLLASGGPPPPWHNTSLVPVLPEVIGRTRPIQFILPDEVDALPNIRPFLGMIEALLDRVAKAVG